MNNQDMNLTAIIMAGGAGTRFWPLSTNDKPKQFLKLFDSRSLLQKSYDRVAGLIPDEKIMVLTNSSLVNLVREQLPELPSENVIGEPMRRDTAAAVCLGALVAKKRFDNPVIVTLTADHLIEPVELFRQTMLSAAQMARETGALYTFGIEPAYPATGYGYLETGLKVGVDDEIEHYYVSSFTEKPCYETACRYYESGNYLWNSGMFVWTAEAILKELKMRLPNHVMLISTALEEMGTPLWDNALWKAFRPLPSISIDLAVMEKAEDVRCVASKFEWKDMGDWQTIKDFLAQDERGNSYRGRFYCLDANNNLVYCEDPDETVVIAGLSDIVTVRAGRRTLITHQQRVQDVKKIVQSVQSGI